jgi:hypothetical protein
MPDAGGGPAVVEVEAIDLCEVMGMGAGEAEHLPAHQIAVAAMDLVG